MGLSSSITACVGLRVVGMLISTYSEAITPSNKGEFDIGVRMGSLVPGGFKVLIVVVVSKVYSVLGKSIW